MKCWSVWGFCLSGIFLFQSCSNQKTNSNSSGELLAKEYCSSCHLFPEPELLDKKTWNEKVLPHMGYFLGMYPDTSFRKTLFEPTSQGMNLNDISLFPLQPIIQMSDWDKIKEYYIQSAPEKLPNTKTNSNIAVTTIFNVNLPKNRFSPPSTTFIKYSNGLILMGDAHTNQFLVLNMDYTIKIGVELDSPPVCVCEDDQFYYVTTMGSFTPTDAQTGGLFRIPKEGTNGAKLLIDKLRRPVHSTLCDLNNDGLNDFVICNFGKMRGSLSVFYGNKNGTFREQILHNSPGAIRAIISDLNHDGFQDVIAEFAQGRESILLFLGSKDGSFKMKTLINFPPSYGSCYFDLEDIDMDGYKDIIYCAGDNADFGGVLKPYHGIYIFQNNGKNEFVKKIFLPLNGVYKALTVDFDKDGDLDIAAISFFPDWEKKNNMGFVLFENQGNNTYLEKVTPYNHLGRWICMDIADKDDDGDMDVFLGSLIMETVPREIELEKSWIDKGLPFLILENTSLFQ